MDALKRAVDRVTEGRRFESFRITARRAFKTSPLSLAGDESRAGRPRARAAHPTRVSLEHPELNVHVEVLPGQAFVYGDRRPGPGGLPVGSSGMVAALLSGGIDSPVAAWRLMKRGCRVIFVHFHSVPYLPDISRGKARALVERLTAWQYARASSWCPSARSSARWCWRCRRRCAWSSTGASCSASRKSSARSSGALALVTGESVGQVASQTLHNLARVDEVADLPVLRPLIGMDKLEITAQAEAIGTFEISIEPDADCCTLFVPKHPGTRASREEIAAVESRLDVAAPGGDGRDGRRARDLRLPRRARAPCARAPPPPARGGAGRR